MTKNETRRSSLFDQFVHDFATKNLNRRVWFVAAVSSLLMIITIVAGHYLLSQNFVIFHEGKAVIKQNNLIELTLDKRYRRLVGHGMQFKTAVADRGLTALEYELTDLVEKEDSLLLKLILKDPEKLLKPLQEISYQLILEDKTYRDLLLENTE
ncbi:MAG: hypothetical protein HQM16_15660 [Deltaproteobacteria bacterium]|nr:hypothetical protein [Deltaproteobacteria bacterium]